MGAQRGRSSKLPPAAELAEMVAAHGSSTPVAEYLGVNYSTVCRALHRAGYSSVLRPTRPRTTELPDDTAQLAAEVNRDGMRAVTERYHAADSTVRSRLTEAGWRALPVPGGDGRLRAYQHVDVLVSTGRDDPIETLVPQGSWADRAACRNVDPETFFPKREGNTAEAKKVCAACPVKSECAEYAIANRIAYGVWGGLSPKERHRLRRVSA